MLLLKTLLIGGHLKRRDESNAEEPSSRVELLRETEQGSINTDEGDTIHDVATAGSSQPRRAVSGSVEYCTTKRARLHNTKPEISPRIESISQKLYQQIIQKGVLNHATLGQLSDGCMGDLLYSHSPKVRTLTCYSFES
jgi:hypothetical protein